MTAGLYTAVSELCTIQLKYSCIPASAMHFLTPHTQVCIIALSHCMCTRHRTYSHHLHLCLVVCSPLSESYYSRFGVMGLLVWDVSLCRRSARYSPWAGCISREVVVRRASRHVLEQPQLPSPSNPCQPYTRNVCSLWLQLQRPTCCPLQLRRAHWEVETRTVSPEYRAPQKSPSGETVPTEIED